MEGIFYTGPCPPQIYERILKSAKLNIPSKPINNGFLVMNRQIWTNQKSHLSMTNAEESASALCALCGEVENTIALRIPLCTVL
jgi:hypothetical protein